MKRYLVTLDERAELSEIKGSHLSQKVINALLNCDEGVFNECQMTGKVIAEILRISMRKVDRVKKRFEGLGAALGGRQGRRPTYMRKADGTFEARLVALSCGEPPEGHAQWSLRLLADRVVDLGYTVSHETVRRVLKKTASSHGSGWVIPPQGNADFAAAKVLDVYRRPAAFPVVCMDETPRPARHGNRSPWRRDGRNDYEYRHCGTCNVFTEPLAGKRMTKVTERKIDWAQFLADIAERYQDATTITLVMDNLNTPRRPL